jgi:hypothetical protein
MKAGARLRFVCVGRYIRDMSDLKYWTNALRKAEQKLDVAPTRTTTNAAVKRMMLAKAELKRLERKPAQASGVATRASTLEL